MTKYVAYYRVSTQKQGQSGLGLEAQQAAVARFIGTTGVLGTEYTEIESGKKNNRVKLAAAIVEAKRSGSRLVIAKLDRLARNVAFIATLMETGVDFVAVDNPTATPFTLHIFAALAEQEATMISQRTKAALQAKKERGDKLGTPENLTREAIMKSVAVRMADARSHKGNIQAAGVISDKVAMGWTLRKIAQHLNDHGYQTRTGKTFTATQVMRLSNRKQSEA